MYYIKYTTRGAFGCRRLHKRQLAGALPILEATITNINQIQSLLFQHSNSIQTFLHMKRQQSLCIFCPNSIGFVHELGQKASDSNNFCSLHRPRTVGSSWSISIQYSSRAMILPPSLTLLVSKKPTPATRALRAVFFPEHINHIRAVAGVDHVGLGAGFDGIN